MNASDQAVAPRPPEARSQAPGFTISPSVLVALPVYNVVDAVPRIAHQALEFARRHLDYRLVLVDDGSIDGTGERIAALLGESCNERVRLVRHTRNLGKCRAILTGLAAACYEHYRYLIFADGDLAYSLDHLPRLVDALAGAEVAIGCRRGADALDGAVLSRRLMGWLFNRAARLCVGTRYRDTQAGLKGFRAQAARTIFPLLTVSDLSFDVEILFLASLLGFRVAEIPAQVGDSHRHQASNVNIMRDPLKMLRSLCMIRINHVRGRYQQI